MLKLIWSRFRSMWKFLYFRKLATFFVGTLCILFFLFSCLTAININNSYKDEVIYMNEQALEQSARVSSVILGDLLNYSYNEYQYGTDLIYLMHNPTYTELASVKASVLMPRLMSYSSLIHSYYIVNYNGGYVCTSNGTYQQLQSFKDENIIEIITMAPSSSHMLQFIPRLVSNADGSTTKVVTVLYASSSKSSFVINLDHSGLVSILNGKTDQEFVKDIIINKNGMVILHYDSNEYSLDFSNNEIYQKINKRSEDKATFQCKIDGQQFYVSYHRGMNGLLFIKLTPNLLLDTTNSLLLKSLGYAIIFLVLGIITCLILAVVLYRPIEILKERITANPPHEPLLGDELGQIAFQYKSIYEQNQDLLKKAKAYHNESRVMAVKKLLDSSFAAITPMQGKLDELEMYLEGPDYMVCLIRLDDSEERIFDNDNALIIFSIFNIITELSEKEYVLECASLSSTELVCIVNHDSTISMDFVDLLAQTRDMINQYFQVTFSCGIGCLTAELEQVTLSYKQASAALNHSFVTGLGSINIYSFISFTPEKAQHYPYDIEKSLVTAIKSLQLPEAESTIKQFFSIISNYYYERITLCCLQLNSCLYQLELQNELIHNEVTDITHKSFQHGTMDSICAKIVARVENMIRSLSEIKSNRSEKNTVITEVKKLVDENLYNTNLSVEILAHEVHLSVNYLRNIFKEGTGISLSNYIIEKKLELVCTLLTDTDLSIQDISDKLGFSTKNYFFTFFKKHTGFTPSQYRKDQKK